MNELLGWLRRRGDPEQAAHTSRGALAFAAVERVLALYAAGLTDSRLGTRLCGPGEPASTDQHHIYLPPQLAEFPSEAENFQLYKLIIAHKQAQVEQGSLERPDFAGDGPGHELAEDVYALVENHRVEDILATELPGLSSFLRSARANAWSKRPALRKLSAQTAGVEALLQLELGGEVRGTLTPDLSGAVERCYRSVESVVGKSRGMALGVAEEVYGLLSDLKGPYHRLPPVHYRGIIRWDRISWAARQEEEELDPSQKLVAQVEEELKPKDDRPMRQPLVLDSRRPQPGAPEGQLEPGSGSQVRVSFADHESTATGAEVELTDEDREGAILYDEWDYRQDGYRARWCVLRERQVRATNERYVEEVLARHHGLLIRLRRQFEALRPERRRLRKQSDGEDVDIDAVVESYADSRARLAPSEKLYVARRETRRDVAVGFLVDLSGSTGGWLGDRRIVDVEKEALILLGEALSVLDDKFGIYGFSGSTRRNCDFYRIKGFAEPMSSPVRARVSGLDTFSYTRMGAPIRHLATLLGAVDAKVRLLLLVSDGRPNDFDAYGGTYGIEDTRRALLECRQKGIRTFCLTVDNQAREYLPHLFGPTYYTILDDVSLLPERLPDLYRRLTGSGS